MRRLHQSHIRFAQKADASLEKVLLGDEVRIQHGHQFPSAISEPVVEVAGFGLHPFRPVQITAAQVDCQLAHFRAAAVIQHPHLGVGIALLPASDQGAFQHGQRFAAGGHVEVHLGAPTTGQPAPLHGIHLLAAIRKPFPCQPEGDQTREQQPAFGHQQHQAEAAGERRAEVEAVGDAPAQVAQGQQADQQDQAAARPEWAFVFWALPEPEGPDQCEQGPPAHPSCCSWPSRRSSAS